MKAPIDVIRHLLLGQPETASNLLAACRTQAYGAEAFGGVMACQMFSRQPAALSREPHLVAANQALAIFDIDGDGREQAIFADLYNGYVGRLWRLGGGETDAEAEAGLVVAVDAKLSQLREGVALSPGDHPELDPAALPALRELAASVAKMNPCGGGALIDGRAFVVRAFTEGDRGAALLAVTTPSGAHRQVHAAASFRFTASGLTHSQVVFDRVPKPSARLTFAPSPTDAD